MEPPPSHHILLASIKQFEELKHAETHSQYPETDCEPRINDDQ